MGRVILDSSVLVAMYYEGDKHYETIAKQLAQESNHYLISTVSLSETLTHAYRRGTGDSMKAQILNEVDEVVDVSVAVATEAARIRSIKTLRLPDAMISATATLHKATLWTFDVGLAKAHEGAVLL
jgi:predicted nucleic acid-binding protein